jgi:hypothetical protein
MSVEEWASKIQQTLAETNVREGLHDDDAIPLVDWGTSQAQHIASRMAAPDNTPPNDEQLSNLGYSLARLLTRITWVVTYRDKKDPTWLTRTFQMINQLNRELHGEDAPVLSDEEIAAWIAGHQGKSNGELVQQLIARLTPAPADTPPPAPPPAGPPSLRDTLTQVFSDSKTSPQGEETNGPSQANP